MTVFSDIIDFVIFGSLSYFDIEIFLFVFIKQNLLLFMLDQVIKIQISNWYLLWYIYSMFCFMYTCTLLQWNSSCEATPFAPEKWPFKRGGLLSGVEINTFIMFMFTFTLINGLSRGVASHQDGLSKRVPLYLSITYCFNHSCYRYVWQEEKEASHLWAQ